MEGDSKTLGARDAETCKSPFGSCLYFTANAVARELTRVAEEAFAPLGLCPSAALLLVETAREPGLLPSKAAQRLHLAPSSVTRFADGLVRRGLITRESKGRTVRLTATGAGLELLPRIGACQSTLAAHLETRVGQTQAGQLAQGLALAAQRLG